MDSVEGVSLIVEVSGRSVGDGEISGEVILLEGVVYCYGNGGKDVIYREEC